MNKKFIIFGVLSILLVSTKISFGMDPKTMVFRGSQLVSGGVIPYLAAKTAHAKYERYKNNRYSPEPFKLDQILFPVSKNVVQFARDRMELVGVPEAQSMPIVAGKDGNWAMWDDAALFVNKTEMEKLDKALRIVVEGEKLHEKSVIDDSHRTIDRDAMIISHESGHRINEDGKTSIFVPVAVAVSAQGASSALSYTFNKAYGIENPQTWSRTLFRSSLAGASIAPKLGILGVGMIAHSRYREATADDLACKKAQSLQELEEFRNFFRERENNFIQHGEKFQSSPRLIAFNNDPNHPYMGDRADKVQKHIDGWKAAHKEV